MVQFIQLTDVKHNNRVLNCVLRVLGCCYWQAYTPTTIWWRSCGLANVLSLKHFQVHPMYVFVVLVLVDDLFCIVNAILGARKYEPWNVGPFLRSSGALQVIVFSGFCVLSQELFQLTEFIGFLKESANLTNPYVIP
jgi:hypothetical protein